jgi:hypothetical protein
MILSVHWRNASKPEQERQRVEAAIEESLLDQLHGAGNAFNLYHDYQTQGKPLGHAWSKAIVKAQDIGTKQYAPCERQFFRFAFTFMDD